MEPPRPRRVVDLATTLDAVYTDTTPSRMVVSMLPIQLFCLHVDKNGDFQSLVTVSGMTSNRPRVVLL